MKLNCPNHKLSPNSFEADLDNLKSAFEKFLNYSKFDQISKKFSLELLQFTELAVESLNRMASKTPEPYHSLLLFKIKWPGMLSPIKAVQEKYEGIMREVKIGGTLNLERKKSYSAPKDWALRLIVEIQREVIAVSKYLAEDATEDELYAGPFILNFNEENISEWIDAIEAHMDYEYGTKSIRQEIRKKYGPLRTNELNDSKLTFEEEAAFPCLLSDPQVEKYCNDSLRQISQTAKSLYGQFKKNAIEEIKRLAP